MAVWCFMCPPDGHNRMWVDDGFNERKLHLLPFSNLTIFPSHIIFDHLSYPFLKKLLGAHTQIFFFVLMKNKFLLRLTSSFHKDSISFSYLRWILPSGKLRKPYIFFFRASTSCSIWILLPSGRFLTRAGEEHLNFGRPILMWAHKRIKNTLKIYVRCKREYLQVHLRFCRGQKSLSKPNNIENFI